MRNAHEVLRGAMNDIQDLLDQDDFKGAKELWHRFNRYSDLHMKMEEGSKRCNARGLFQLVDDHANESAKKAELRHHHSTLYELEEDVVDVFENAPDVQRAKEVYPIFREENVSHLEEEEEVLMPAIQRIIRHKFPVKKYIKTDILPVLLAHDGDMEFFIRFSNEILQKHDVVDGKPMPRVRVFDHALWALATSEQWTEWSAWIQDTVTPEKYQELTTAIADYKADQRLKNAPPIKSLDAPPMKSILKAPEKKGFFQKIFSSTTA